MRILVLGTQLPSAMNKAIVQLSQICHGQIEIIHELKRNEVKPSPLPLEGSCNYTQIEPSMDRAPLFAWADCLVASAGAMTIAKMGIVGLGGLIVPLHSKQAKQHQNVANLVERGAIFLLRPSQWNVEALLEQLVGISRSDWCKRACAAYQPQSKLAEALINEALSDCLV